MILKGLVHAADIGNPTRPFDIAMKWAENIVSEFFDQGDKERCHGFEISMLCDRHTTNFAKSQIGFLNFVISPYFNVLNKVFPKFESLCSEISTNVEIYQGKVEEFEEIMKKGNDHL